MDRARELRRRSREVLQRSAQLRERGPRPRSPRIPRELEAELLLTAAREILHLRERRRHAQAEARENAEVEAWFRERVEEMLDDGWTRAELADVGVTDALLRELRLDPPA